MAQAEGDGGVALVVVSVVDLDLDAAVAGEVGAVEAVGREGALPAMQKPVGMLDEPGRVDSHVVGHHVAGQPQAEVRSAVLQVVISLPAAQIFCYVVVLERVGGGDRILVAAQALDGARCNAALPEADEPQSSDAARGQQLQLLVGDLVQAMDVAQIFFGELFQPDVGALGHQHHVGHPGLVGAEVFVLVERGLIVVCVTAAAQLVEADVLIALESHRTPGGPVAELVGAGGMEAHPDGEVLFAQHVDGQQDALDVVAEEGRPALADKIELADQRVGRSKHGRAQRVVEAADLRCHGRARAEEIGEGRGHVGVDGLLLQGLVREELMEGLEGGVAVGNPQHQELFQRGLAVGPASG